MNTYFYCYFNHANKKFFKYINIVGIETKMLLSDFFLLNIFSKCDHFIRDVLINITKQFQINVIIDIIFLILFGRWSHTVTVISITLTKLFFKNMLILSLLFFTINFIIDMLFKFIFMRGTCYYRYFLHIIGIQNFDKFNFLSKWTLLSLGCLQTIIEHLITYNYI